MAKVRIFEWAKKNRKRSSDIVTTLKKEGYNITNHTSQIEEKVLEGLFNKPTFEPKKADLSEKSTQSRPQNKPNYTQNSNYKGNNARSQSGDKPYNKPSNGSRSNYNNRPNQANKPSQGNRPSQGGRPAPGGNQNRNFSQKPPYNKFNKKPEEKSDLEPTADKKPVTKKGNNAKRKTQKYDRLSMFDTKEKNQTDQKTKTQLKKEAREQREEEIKNEVKEINYSPDMTVSEFAKALGVPAIDIVAKLFELGIIATINQVLDKDAADVLTVDYNVVLKEVEADDLYEIESLIEEFDESNNVTRPPIVTIMGHVDHGKTTLLDTIRKTKVTEKESGGITQHIGAYQINYNGRDITFLDTPGHAAFSAMRARGAQVTDITILVVAGDDGVKPQTLEAISHVKEAKTPLIVAVNKMDKPGIDTQRVMTELAEHGITSEAWGGETPFVEISALQNKGIDDLLNYVELIADINEFKAPEKIRGYGTVIESNLDKGRGSVATIIVEGGEVNLGDPIVIGHTWGNVRVMQDENGKQYKKLTASMPAEITGIKDIPKAGDRFVVLEDTKQAQLIGEKRSEIQSEKDRNRNNVMSLDELNNMIAEGNIKELPIIVKADVHGSAEALATSLEQIEVNGVKVRIVHRGVGAINESDVLLSQSGNAIIIGFNVRPDANAKSIIEKENITLIINNIIYNILEEIEDSMRGMREKKYREEILGYAKIGEVFKITGVGKVAGCIVTSGKISRQGKVRLVRDGVVIYDGDLGQLKRYKDDVSEVVEGQDCGMSIVNFSDYKKDDEFESYLLLEEDLDKLEEKENATSEDK